MSSYECLDNSQTYVDKAYIKNIESYKPGLTLELDIWDTYEDILSLSELFTRDARGCFILWDISDPDNLDKIEDWYDKVRSKTDYGDFKIPIFLVANKIDLLNGKARLN